MLAPNTVLQNRYHILRLLGQGGMGAVYLAADLRFTNRQVVVKENLGGDPRQFQVEANLLATLDHPNLPRVSDNFVESNGAQYLVMDFIEGQNLDQMVQQQGPLAEATVLGWFRQVLDAVQYLHAKHILHRDIKPQNIIITPIGKAMLVDFGIAKVMVSGQSTFTGARAGSPGFAAPEQYAGGTTECSDIYSLGATLYYSLTARVPPEAPLRIANALALVPPRRLVLTISPQIETAILRAMELDMARRWQTVGELRAGLVPPIATTSPLSSRPTPLTTPGIPSRPTAVPPAPSRPASAIPTWAWAVGGAVAALIIVLALLGLSGGFGRTATPVSTLVGDLVPTAGRTAASIIPPTAAPTITPATPGAYNLDQTGTAAASGGEIKVAILVPLSGAVPSFGISTRDGALLAIQEWNAKGGVLGKKITPVVEDGQCSPAPAVNAANKVIDQDKVHYIIGEVCSKASIPVSEIASKKKVIQISPTSTNTSVTVDANGKVKPYIFRACFIDSFQGTVGAKFALHTLQAKTAFIMSDPSNGYVKELADFFQKTFTDGGGQVLGRENYSGQDTDFSAILAKVAAAKPDMVYLPDYYNVINLVTKQAKAKGITVPFMGGDGWDSSDLDLTAAAGGYYTNHYSPDDPRPEVQNFVKTYGAAYKDDQGKAKVPDALAALAYDATNLLIAGIQQAGVDDTDQVQDALMKINFSAVSGKITFDRDHNPVKSAIILAVQQGKVVFNSTVNP